MSSESDTQMETEEQKRQREWYEHYRSIFDEEEHAQFVQFIGFPVRSREMLGLELPSRPIRLPLANDTGLSDSQKVKFELKYLAEIFDSWLDTVRTGDNGNFFTTSLSRSSVCNCAYNHELEVQYFHDGRWYNSFPSIGSKMKGRQKIFYLQIPLVNNGYCYRVVGTDEICRDEITLHQGKTHSQGIGGYVELKPEAASPLSRFATFARDWFGSEDLDCSVYYNGNRNRVDILFGRNDFPKPGQKLMLEFCFEPGWPVKTFEANPFPATLLLGSG
jgi:hypothetical protein